MLSDPVHGAGRGLVILVASIFIASGIGILTEPAWGCVVFGGLWVLIVILDGLLSHWSNNRGG